MTLKIMEARAYVRAKNIIEAAKSQDEIPDNPIVDMVWAIQHDIARESRLKRGHS